VSFKDRDETPEEKKKREFSENPKNFPAITVRYCHQCGCHYTGGCKEHASALQSDLKLKQ